MHMNFFTAASDAVPPHTLSTPQVGQTATRLLPSAHSSKSGLLQLGFPPCKLVVERLSLSLSLAELSLCLGYLLVCFALPVQPCRLRPISPTDANGRHNCAVANNEYSQDYFLSSSWHVLLRQLNVGFCLVQTSNTTQCTRSPPCFVNIRVDTQTPRLHRITSYSFF